MSGHSKWSTIKRKKGAIDAKRGKIFTKLIREITVAARVSGGDPNLNPRLRLAIDKAKGANMPNDNIDRAVKKGTGQDDTTHFEEYTLEGYGPGRAAVLLEVMTDNKNRTTPEVRRLFQENGGTLGAAGAVAWQFRKRGIITVDKRHSSEDQLLEITLEAGAEDIREAKEEFEIITPAENFVSIKKVLDEKKIPQQTAEISMLPQNTVALSGASAKQMLELMEALEDHDDVQNVYANFDIDDATMAQSTL